MPDIPDEYRACKCCEDCSAPNEAEVEAWFGRIEQQQARIRELEDAVLEVISAQENGPLRQATLHDPNMGQMRRRLRALLFDEGEDGR